MLVNSGIVTLLITGGAQVVGSPFFMPAQGALPQASGHWKLRFFDLFSFHPGKSTERLEFF